MDPAFESFQTRAEHVVPGDWFLPMTIKGIDQHDRISEAITRGAVGVTFEERFLQKNWQENPLHEVSRANGARLEIPELPVNVSSFSVPDLRAYLFEQAQKKRSKIRARIVTIAGSVGKTSVKEILGHILKGSNPERVHVSHDNQNTKIALATQILRLTPQIETAVFEVGARQTHDFQIPLNFLQPEVVALLNIGTAHVGEFGSLEALRKEKLSILKAPTARKLVISADNDFMAEFKSEVPTLSFGHSPLSDVRIVQESPGQTRIQFQDQERLISHPRYLAPGSGLNVAAAIALSLALDIKWPQILAGLESFPGTPRRFEMFQWNGMTAIDDAFNASPESMAQGLRHLAQYFSHHKILLVLGSMLELGERSQPEHEKVADLIMTLFTPRNVGILVVGEDSRHLYERLLMNPDFSKSSFHAPTTLDAKPILKKMVSEFHLIYAKASKAIELQRIFADL